MDFVKKIPRWLLAVIPVLLLLFVFVMFAVLGKSELLNFGGLLKKILGIRNYINPLEIIPESEPVRPVPIGVPDTKYWVELKTHEIKISKNPLRDKEMISVIDDGKKVDIALPSGIEDVHVSQVVSIKPQVYVVKIKDNSGIRVGNLLDSLPK